MIRVIIVFEVFISMQAVAASGSESRIVERVSRRLTNDIYHYINSSIHMICLDNTYLISEDQCVKDEELFKGCTDAIVPTSSQHNNFIITTIAVFDSSLAITYLLGNVTTYKTFKINETNQLVNSSLCHISSLEVYRGRHQAIEISHQGFSLSENGSVKITTDELGYDLEDYVGELYRMNLSCFGGGLPESACLFFKVASRALTQSPGYVTNAKFNCTAPGTLYDFIEECNIITTSDKMPTETISIVTAMVTTTVTSASDMPTNVPSSFGITLLASVIGDVVIVVILAVSIMIICVIIKFKVGSLRKFNGQSNTLSSTVTASSNTIPQKKTPDHKETSIHIPEVSANVQDQEGSSQEVPSQNPTYINLDPDHCHPVKNPAYVHIFDS